MTAVATIETLPLEPVRVRVRIQTIVLVAGGLFGIHLLSSQVGMLPRTIAALRTAKPSWLLLAAFFTVGTYLAAGVAQLGAASRPLSYFRTARVQVASSFANKLTPASLGGAAVNIRYLQRAGLDRSDAYAAVALNSAAGAVVHVGALALAVFLVGRGRLGFANTATTMHLLLAFAAALAVVGFALRSPLGRRRVIPPLQQGAVAVVAALREPVKAAQLFGGSAAITTLYMLALWSSLHAAHSGLPVITVAAVYLGSSAIASAAPTPGGIGAMEAVLVAGLTGLGAAAGPAIAGVLAFRFVTFWLPILPGWLVLRGLQRQGLL